MVATIAIFTICIGMIIGSFLNVCIYRIPREESIAYPPSHCTNCNNKILTYDLIPVISYIFLRGKCRHCGEKISTVYPLIELLTGLLFLGIYFKYGLTFEFIKYCIFVCLVIVIGMIDLNTTDIYFSTTLTGGAFGTLFLLIGLYLGYDFKTYLYGALLGGGVISLIIIVTKGMGWGDAEICFVCGLFLGFKLTLLTLFLSFVTGSLIGLALIALKRKTRKDYIPFGPFISLASIITVLWGQNIMAWYLL